MSRHDGGSPADVARWRGHLQAELDGALIYRTLAEVEPQPELAEVYRRLAEAELRHAEHWRAKLREAGVEPALKPSWRARVLSWLARRFGTEVVLPVIVQQERGDRARYDAQMDARSAGLPAAERSHARLLSMIAGTTPRGLPGSVIARLEGRHRFVGGNALRAAVLGANDGLVSNLNLVMGVAGAELSGDAILITGLAGLLAGATSMALGEWLSVQSARELFEQQLAIEAEELDEVPEEEQEELALIFQAKGLPEPRAREMAERLMSDRTAALDTLAREELGIDPEELGGSALTAAATSFVLFAVGAIIPVVPFLFSAGRGAVASSIVVSGLALFGIGAAITLLTGRSVWYSGLRQLGIGLLTAAVTYGVGALIGISLPT
ncbi:MAG: rubrerythrin family protein [Planctomycetota bacterium]|nr:MAG: rubrerythrin family protein [Planctomycetota bacterium]